MHDLNGVRVAVLGLAFKPQTDDVRESPALDIVPLLIEEGARVRIYDPIAADHQGLLAGAESARTVWEALDGAAAAILVTEWDEFRSLDWGRVRGSMSEPAIVFDGRNALDPSEVRSAGLTYMAVGRPGAHRRSSQGV
jgi:UDPglucose 6-dehydrogenase